MASAVKALGATLRPDLSAHDWEVLDSLSKDCRTHEKKDTFFPFFASCGECKGFIYGGEGVPSVRRQLGVCGCVIAYEMEMRSAGIRAPAMQPTLTTKSPTNIQMKYFESILALGERGNTSCEEMRHLHFGRMNCASRARPQKTRYQMTRHRMAKDKALPMKK